MPDIIWNCCKLKKFINMRGIKKTVVYIQEIRNVVTEKKD